MILTVLGAPFAILFDLHGTITWSTLNALLLTACVMAAASGACFVVGRQLRRPGQSLPLAITLTVALGAALCRTTLGPIVLTALDQESSIIERTAFTALPTMFLILTINAGLEWLATIRHQRSLLVEELVELDARRLRQQALTDAMSNALLTNVLTATDDLRRRVGTPEPYTSAADRLDVADALRTTAIGSLRDLSHELHRANTTPPLRPRGFLRTFFVALQTNPLWPVETAAVSALIASFGSAVAIARISATDSSVGPMAALAITVIWVLTQFVLVWGSVRAIAAAGTRWRIPAVVQLVLAVCATAAISNVRTELTFGAFSDTGGAEFASLGLVVAIFVVIGTTSALATQLSEAELIEALRTTVGEKEAAVIARNHELVRASRTLARYVHGTLQSRLLSSALAIEQAERDGDADAFDAALEQAREALSLPDVFASPIQDLESALEATVALWQGFVHITIEYRGAIPTPDPETVLDLCRIVEEGVTNAVRHGGASFVDIELHATDSEDIEVTITDDGSGPTGGAPGLGSTLFDIASAWSLTRGATGGAVLTVRLAQHAARLTPQAN